MFVNNRLKQEEEERKRIDDKARRDAIFEKYLRRKMAVEGVCEADLLPAAPPPKSTPSSAQVVLRKKSKHGAARPMSQPPPASSHVTPSGSAKTLAGGQHFVSHASDDNLLDPDDLPYTTRSE